MKMIHTAWRNMWRNRGRTLLSATAIFLTSLIICLVISLEDAFILDMKDNVIANLTGDIRIMNSDYIRNERITPLQFFVENTEPLMKALRMNPYVSSVSPRSDFGVSIYRENEQIPSRAIGVDFETAPLFKKKNNRLVSGQFPKPSSSQVLVTSGLAQELSLEPGDKFTAITRTAISGSNGKTFTVSGVIQIADTDFAHRVFFMDSHTAAQYLRMNDNSLQIQVFLKNERTEKEALVSIKQTLAEAGFLTETLDIRPWHQVNTLYAFFTLANVMYAIIGSIFYLLASTVIFNTTMMSVLERKKEIGTLMALGMEKARLVRLFLLESTLISAVGAAGGTFCGFIIVTAAGRFGIDIEALWGTSLSGMSFSRIVYPALAPHQYLAFFLLGVGISIAACYLPARMVTKVEPADALADR